MSYNTDFKKKQFLQAYPVHECNISKTCDYIGINRKTFYNWLDLDDVFRQHFEYYSEKQLDRAEEVINSAVDNGNLKAAMFLLTTKGKNRGYTTKSTIEAIQKKDVVFSFEPVKDNKSIEGPKDNIIDIDYQELPEADT